MDMQLFNKIKNMMPSPVDFNQPIPPTTDRLFVFRKSETEGELWIGTCGRFGVNVVQPWHVSDQPRGAFQTPENAFFK